MLFQRLRRWPTLTQHLVRVRFGWESSHCQYAVSPLFPDPHGNTTVCVARQSPIREMVNYFLIVVAQVYRVYMIWELALNAAMKRT